ncbi:MAG: hypothetical protein MJB12_11995 [Firmicutes bacterium]|nr:hypothetical protein [Bacillota bacterium]
MKDSEGHTERYFKRFKCKSERKLCPKESELYNKCKIVTRRLRVEG